MALSAWVLIYIVGVVALSLALRRLLVWLGVGGD